MCAGRPAKYKTVKEMKTIIEEYFKACEGEILKEKDGTVVLNKYGQPVIVGEKPPTVTGLALALGFNSRQSLLNYQDKPQFMDTITHAKSRIEEYAESRLFDKDGVNGAKFNLINNFKGWKEEKKVEQSGTTTTLYKDVNDMTIEQIEEELKRLESE